MEQGFLIAAIILQIALGTYIFVRNPRARVNRLLAWCSLFYTLGVFAGLLSSLPVDENVAVNLLVFSTIFVYIWSGTFVGLCVLAIFYPRRLEDHRVWTLYVPVGVATVATTVILALHTRLSVGTGVLGTLLRTGEYSVGAQAFSLRAGGIAYSAVWAIISLVLLINVAVRRSGSDRQSAILLSVLVLLPGVLGTISAQTLIGAFRVMGPTLGSVILFMAFAYVIIRYRLFSTEEAAVGLALDNLSDGMLITRHDHVVLDCNTRASEMLGLPKREIVHARIEHILAHSPLPDTAWQNVVPELERGQGTTGEVRYGVGQAERVAVYEAIPICGPGRDLQGYVWLIRDVTELRHSQEQIEARNQDLQTAIEELQDTSRVQSQLIQTIRGLSAPAVPILEGIIVMPLSGQIDSERAQRILDNLLRGIDMHQAKIAILDITGVPVVDTAVAQYLIQAARAASLMGCRPFLVGIRPEIAQVIVELGIDMSGLETFMDLQGGVEKALQALGLDLVHTAGANSRVVVR